MKMAAGSLPLLVMVIVQFGFAGMNIFSKLAMDSGMNPFVHVAYRQIFASVVVVPFAYFIERGKRPPLTLSLFIQIFICSIFGMTLNQTTYFVGLKNSTPTVACALSNLLPAITFILAVLFKQENAKVKTLAGQAKLIGTILGVGGAMLLSFYHGPVVPIGESHIHLNFAKGSEHDNHSGRTNLLGPSLVILSAFAWAIWFVLQAKMCNTYPAPYSSSALMLSMSSVQCVIVALFMEHNLSGWTLVPAIRAVSSIYAGVICSGLAVCMMSWCIEKKGPLFVSMFSPLLLVIVAALSWAFLREKLFLGTVLGSFLIVMGLYGVLWGKSKEMRTGNGIEMEPQGHEEQEQEQEQTRRDLEMQ